MPLTLTLLTILSGVCFLLWGLRTTKRAVLRGYGAYVQAGIAAGTQNRFTALGSGMLVTFLLQSSIATTLLTSSFVGRGLMTATAGLAVVVGADLGASIIAKLLSFDLSWLPPLLLSTGIIFHLIYDDGNQKRFAARVILGLGFVMTGLGIIRMASAPLSESDILPLILNPLESEVILAILISVALTILMHSSLSAVLLFATLASNNVLSLDLAVIFMLGANIGSGVIPLFTVIRDTPQALQIPMGNVLMRLTVAVLFLVFLQDIHVLLEMTAWQTQSMVLGAHIGFNLALALLFTPFIGYIALLCEKLSPARESEISLKFKPRYLDKKALSSPSAALSCAMRETLHMAEVLEVMLDKTYYAISNHDEHAIESIKQQDEVLDTLFAAIKDYIIRLTREELSDKEADQSMRIMNFATNMEHCGDIIENSLMINAAKMARRKDTFSDEGLKEIKAFHDKVYSNLKLAQSIFLSSDPALARQLLDYKRGLVKAERESIANHMKRLREGLPQTIATSGMHTDVIRDLRRINTYITSIAYGILDENK